LRYTYLKYGATAGINVIKHFSSSPTGDGAEYCPWQVLLRTEAYPSAPFHGYEVQDQSPTLQNFLQPKFINVRTKL